MKITFDTAGVRFDANALGALLNMFMRHNGGHPNTYPAYSSSDWTFVSSTPRPLMVAVMGDAVYGHAAPVVHLRHNATDLQVLWFVDGDMTLAYHMAEHDDPGHGFTIVNSRGGRDDCWMHDDLVDPRNDPSHNPWG